MFRPHYAICKCHNLHRLIVVKAGLCQEGNEDRKKTRKAPTSPKPRKPIKKVSDKRKKLNALYSILRTQFLKDHPKCQASIACQQGESTDIHHLFWGKDREKHLNDFSNVLAVCRKCHKFIHDKLSAEEARRLGFKK